MHGLIATYYLRKCGQRYSRFAPVFLGVPDMPGMQYLEVFLHFRVGTGARKAVPIWAHVVLVLGLDLQKVRLKQFRYALTSKHTFDAWEGCRSANPPWRF